MDGNSARSGSSTPIPGISGGDDLSILTKLVDELATTLEDNHNAVDELCRLADGITLNGSDQQQYDVSTITAD